MVATMQATHTVPSGTSKLCGAVNLRYGAEAGYPCTRIDHPDAITQRPGWRGLSAQQVLTCCLAAEPQRDDWSCATNSAARMAAGMHQSALSAAAYHAFKAATPSVDLQTLSPAIDTFFALGPSGIGNAVTKSWPRFGPTPFALAGHAAAYLGVHTGLLHAATPEACKLWLQQSVGPTCAAVLLMSYGHFAMHYVGLAGIDTGSNTALLVETNGNVFGMDLDVVVASMEAGGTVGEGLGLLKRFNAVALSAPVAVSLQSNVLRQD